MRPLLLMGFLVAASVQADDKPLAPASTKARPTKVSDEGLGKPAYLSDLARQILRRRMERHGRDATHLMTAVVLIKRETVQTLAQSLAGEPRIVRPLPDSRDDLNAALPERFFVLQDELRDRARTLGEAAKSRSDRELGEAFSALTQTCVACHSTFLNPKPEETR